MITHIPFIFYIGKEQFLMAYDEYHNRNICNMVERVINESGDPRYFLAELRRNSKASIKEGGHQKYVFLHRLPHMKLPKKILRKINVYVYLFAIGYAIIYQYFPSVNIIPIVVSAFDLFIIPGLFYYLKHRQKWLREDVNVPMYILHWRKCQKARILKNNKQFRLLDLFRKKDCTVF